jgi:AP-4 complex subunit sigma-1
MTIQFVLLVNKQGQTRLAKYTDSSMTTEERRALEAEIVRKCLTRVDKQASPPAAAWLLLCHATKAS